MNPTEANACAHPCRTCPFRKNSLMKVAIPIKWIDNFICHSYTKTGVKLSCAGAIIFGDKINAPVQVQRIATSFQDPIKYSETDKDAIMETREEFLEYHKDGVSVYE